jgi:hypothetical protein
VVWQGCFGDWQPLFIGEYWLPLGQMAWQGFLAQGRGLVLCHVQGEIAAVDWSCTPVPYSATYVPLGQGYGCWRSLSLPAEDWPAVEGALAGYEPTQDVVLVLLGEGQPYVTCLKNWAVPPPECDRQMGDRQSEFALPFPST